MGRRLRGLHDTDGCLAYLGLPGETLERELLSHLEQVAADRYGIDGFYLDGERRRIPDHWHAHARPAGGFFDPRSALYEEA